MTQFKLAKVGLIFCGTAAICYNSWIIGYALDVKTAKTQLASELERVGHPYFWLFILGDILTGLSLIIFCYIVRYKLWHIVGSTAMKNLLYGLLFFSSFTIFAALLPSQCTITSVLRCGAGAGKGLGLDGLFSVIAGLGFFLSQVAAMYFIKHHKIKKNLMELTSAVLISWTISSLLFILYALSSGPAHILQQTYIILSGFVMIFIGLYVYWVVEKTYKKN